MTDPDRTRRNLNPHAEARLAMAIWDHEYAHGQDGGSMDFWDSRSKREKRFCREVVTSILEAYAKNGRAP